MRPADGEVLHFSEDPTIPEFVPHVAATARVAGAFVWAVDHDRAPSYWFPRQCPRVLAWAGPSSTADDVEAAGIELRVLPELWSWWAVVSASTLGFGGIRLRNAWGGAGR